MPFVVRAIVLAGVLLSVPLGARADDDAATQAFAHLRWSTSKTALSESHGSFTPPSDGSIVVGADAAKADELINHTSSSNTEGFVQLKDGSTLYLSYADEGYVKIDDWSDVNADDLLKSMTDGTNAENEERAKNGGKALHVDGWVQQPTLDRQRSSVMWIVKLHEQGGDPFVNATAIALGRHGYEHFTLATNAGNTAATRTLLASLVNDFQFDKGFRFSDYADGDKLAGYGIAALIGTAAGATIAKTVGFGAILLLIKKFFIVIVAALAAAFAWLKRRFSRQPAAAPAPPAPQPTE